MSEFGNELRREREGRGIGLDAISDATKISVRHLQALEAGKFDQLPGGVFNKGIVRSYARVVGLDEEECIGRYMTAYQGSGMIKDDDVSWIEFAENVSKNRAARDVPRMRLRWAGVALLLTILAVLGWFVWHYVSNKLAAENTLIHSVHRFDNRPSLSARAVPCSVHSRPDLSPTASCSLQGHFVTDEWRSFPIRLSPLSPASPLR